MFGGVICMLGIHMPAKVTPPFTAAFLLQDNTSDM